MKNSVFKPLSLIILSFNMLAILLDCESSLKLEDIIDEYRDLIVLILICYAIYLFVSIINDV